MYKMVEILSGILWLNKPHDHKQLVCVENQLENDTDSPSLSLPLDREFAKTIKRPFSVYYNPYTQSIDLLKDTRSIENVVQELRSDLTTVCDALGKMNTYMGI